MAKLINTRFRVSTRGATKAILPKLAQDFNRIFKRNQKRLERIARDIVIVSIRNHATYESLLSDSPNDLRAELGLEDPIGQIKPILDHWENSIKVKIDPVKAAGTRLSGGIEVLGINASFKDAVFLPTASFIAERAQKQNIVPFEIAWLEWLLLRGEEALVYGFFVDTELKDTDKSRTGLAVMRDAKLDSFVWRIPKIHRGTKEENWITKSVADCIPEIRAEIISTVMSQLGKVQRIS